MANQISLIVGNQKISGWTQVSVTRSLDTLASSFDMSMIDVWEGEPVVLQPELECKIDIDGQRIITGYIDNVGIPVDASSRSYKVSGRSKTADLVDCSTDTKSTSWNKIGVLKLARLLADPYGIKVSSETDLGEDIRNFSINPGESPFDCLLRVCADRAILMTTDTNGDLLLTSAGRNRATDKLICGQNILSAEASYEFADRFSKYIIKGQKSGDGNPWGKTTNSINATATDPAIKRNRVKIFTADDEMTNSLAKKKVAWEAQIRAGKSGVITVGLSTWFQSDGSLWAPNILTACDISPLRVTPDSPLLINEVKYTQGSDGTRSTLKLVREDTYAAEPRARVKTKSSKETMGFNW